MVDLKKFYLKEREVNQARANRNVYKIIGEGESGNHWY